MVRNVQTLSQARKPQVRKSIDIGGKIKLRPWGYESQGSPRTKFLLSITPIKQWVAVGKDAFMRLMRDRFPDESRQNLGKIPLGDAITGNLARYQFDISILLRQTTQLRNLPNHPHPTQKQCPLGSGIEHSCPNS
jgi:hypothetical protein